MKVCIFIKLPALHFLTYLQSIYLQNACQHVGTWTDN